MAFGSTSLLQFDELKQLIATYAGSEPGKERVLECDPRPDRYSAEAQLAEAGEAISYLQDASATQKAGKAQPCDCVLINYAASILPFGFCVLKEHA